VLVEHTFVTTLPPAETFGAAAMFLQQRGFVALPQEQFPVGPHAWNALEVRRGVANPARAKTVLDLPQHVRLGWDRGRVEVAASVTPKPRGSGKSFVPTGFATSGDWGGSKAQDPAIGQLLLTIARCLELLLAHRNGEQAAAEWDQYHAAASEAGERQRRRSRRIAIIAVIASLLAIGLAVWAGISSSAR
jgi:hypothetical protein